MAAAERELKELILEVKTTGPDFDPSFVRRENLIGNVRSGPARLVTVTAPAGYGKTSFLAEWLQLEDRATGWLTLSDGDDDPAALIRLLTYACSSFTPVAASLEEQVSTADRGVLGRIAPVLARALSRCDQPFVLFLDDTHALTSLDAIDALNVVLTGVPAGSQVVLASRHRPAAFARGRVASSAAHVTAEDLRIDLSGAARIAEVAGAEVSPETLTSWVEQSGGWAAGLHMCALLSRSRPLDSIGGQDLLADYLYRECMRELPDDIRRFLVSVSILRPLVPAMCDAVLERSDSASILRDLEARQLFITADPQRRSYRLHPLFAEYLQAELHLDAGPTVRGLHMRAAAWCHEQGLLPEAINHAIAGGDFATASSLVALAALNTYTAGETTTLGRWISQIGDANLLANPFAVVVVTWYSLLSGTDAAAQKWASLLGSMPDDAPRVDGIDLVSAKAMVRAITMKHGMRAALEDAEFAVRAEPVESPWRDPALQILGSTLLHTGHDGRAREVLMEAIHTAEAHGNPATIVMCEVELAQLAIDGGDWAAADAHVQRALDAIQTGNIDGYIMCAYAHAAAAYTALHAGRRSAGEKFLSLAMSERGRCMGAVPLISIPTRLFLIHANLQVGDIEAARMLSREIDEILPPRDGREALDARVAAAARAVDERERLGRHAPSTALTVAEQRVLPYLQTYLTQAEIAKRLYVSRNTVSSHVSAIFRKLDASSRAEAVETASTLGLLGGLQTASFEEHSSIRSVSSSVRR
ncbi:LuxR C-terminal-related transcriptional regulator [Agromyces sp. NPDC127015]|uniref:helix-turn-helix transcriptional regulator n=1 Tax=Agromyces sp. NPDC127015 TaxID=3347108 RepID=UPI00364C77E1